MARDCPDRRPGASWRTADLPQRSMKNDEDQEFEKMMLELGGGNGPAGNIEAAPAGEDDAATGGRDERPLKPWERGPTGAPAPWKTNNAGPGNRDDRNGGSNPRPWGNRGGNDNDRGGSHGYGGQNQGGGSAPWKQHGQRNDYDNNNYGGNHNTYGNQYDQYGHGYGAQQYGGYQQQGWENYGGYQTQSAPGVAPWGQAGSNGYDAPPPPPPPGEGEFFFYTSVLMGFQLLTYIRRASPASTTPNRRISSKRSQAPFTDARNSWLLPPICLTNLIFVVWQLTLKR